MKITVAAVGRGRSSPAQVLFDDYAKRMTWPISLREVEERRPLSGTALKSREAELLLGVLPKGALLIALDEGGKTFTSETFARFLDRFQSDGVSDLGFVIGGAEGLDPGLLSQAAHRLSLGTMTWPHILARALLAEQIYRAQTILTGHPYHRA